MDPFKAVVLEVEIRNHVVATDPAVIEVAPNLPKNDGSKHHAEDSDRSDVDGFEKPFTEGAQLRGLGIVV